MAKIKLPQALTANRLIDGDVVYLTAEGTWSPHFTEAQVIAPDADPNADMARFDTIAAQSEALNEITGAYWFDVTAEGEPASQKERIRAKGPTIRTDLGKQAA